MRVPSAPGGGAPDVDTIQHWNAALRALAVHLSAGHEGPARAGLAVVTFVAAFLLLGTVSLVFDTAGRHPLSPANI